MKPVPRFPPMRQECRSLLRKGAGIETFKPRNALVGASGRSLLRKGAGIETFLARIRTNHQKSLPSPEGGVD